MAPRFLQLSLAFLGLAGFAVAAACGGGESPSETGAAPTPTASDSRGFQPQGSTPGSGTTSPAATATLGPSGPEGAAPKVTTRRRSTGGGEEVGSSSGAGDPTAIPFVAPLDHWDSFRDPFGVDRGNGLVHGGVDFILDTYPNAPIYAACDGWVAGINDSDTHGKHMVIKCGDTLWTTVYAHLGDTVVAVNDDVLAGKTMIARSGGPTAWGHEMLHFELRWDFVPVDPAAHIDFNVRPSFTVAATPTPDDGAPTPGGPTPTATKPAGSTPVPGVPTATPTNTPTPTPTLWYVPTATPTPPPPQATPTPTRTPVPTPTPRPPTPTPTPLPQAF